MSDLIKRSDAIKHLKRWFHSKGWMVSDEDCKSILWDIPSADRPQGEWNDFEADEWYGMQYKCSLCGHITIDVDNYCPNCGSRNRKENE